MHLYATSQETERRLLDCPGKMEPSKATRATPLQAIRAHVPQGPARTAGRPNLDQSKTSAGNDWSICASADDDSFGASPKCLYHHCNAKNTSLVQREQHTTSAHLRCTTSHARRASAAPVARAQAHAMPRDALLAQWHLCCNNSPPPCTQPAQPCQYASMYVRSMHDKPHLQTHALERC